MRPILFLEALVLGALCGCAERGTLGEIAPPPPTEIATDTRIFVATTRAPTPDSEMFSADRSRAMSFGLFDVSIPVNREPGLVSYPDAAHPAELTFSLSQTTVFPDRPTFQRNLHRELALNPETKAVIVFVHGYNTNFAEGVYRFAQIKHDLRLTPTTVLYSWPSAGKAVAYLDDLDSSLTARDGFEELLDAIAMSDATDILIVAHSMGSMVALESVRQASLRAYSPALSKLRAIFLLSPDISVELFDSQRSKIDRHNIPICVLASSRDRVLALSSRLRGGENRLGQVTQQRSIVSTLASVIDISQFIDRPSGNHFAVASAAPLIAFIKNNRANVLFPCVMEAAEGKVTKIAANR